MRWLFHVVRHLGGLTVFVLALLVGVALHIDVPTVRRTVVGRVNEGLAAVLQGRLHVLGIGELGLAGLEGADAEVYDPDGVLVLRLEGLRTRIDTLDLLRSVYSGSEIHIDLADVSAARADVDLDADKDGVLRLARAFASGAPNAPAAPPASTTPTQVVLRMPHIAVGHTLVHGQPPGSIAIDADVNRLSAALDIEPDHLRLALEHAEVDERGLPGGLEARGTLEGTLELSLPSGKDFAMHASWHGALGSVTEGIEASYDRGIVDAVVDVPSTSPEALRSIWPACPFGAPAALHAWVAGTPSAFFATVHASVGPGTLDLDGPVSLGAETRASAHVAVTKVDLHALDPSAPTSDLSAVGDVLVAGASNGPFGGLAAFVLAPGTVGPTRVPSATITGDFLRDAPPAMAMHAHALLVVREPGAPTTVRVQLAPKGTSYELAFDGSADVPRLDGIARVGPVARGHAHANVKGTVDLGNEHIDAQVDLGAGDVAVGPVELGEATVAARATGPLSNPTLDGELHGSDLVIAGIAFSKVRAEMHGPTTGAAVEVALRGRGPELVARAKLAIGRRTDLSDVEVLAEHDGGHARLKAAHVSVEGQEIQVEDAVVEGLGDPLRGSLHKAPGSLELTAHSRGMDLARLAHFAGEDGLLEGQLAIEANATLRPASATGHVTLDVTKASVGLWQDAEAHVDVALGRRISGHVSARLADIGSVDVTSTSVTLGGESALEATAWRSMSGTADVKAHVDLGKLAAVVPASMVPARRVSGVIDLTGRVGRDSPTDETPAVDLTAKTTGVLAANPFGASWTLKGIDAEARLRVDGTTGAASLDVTAADAKGTLVVVATTSDAVPFGRLLAPDPPFEEIARSLPTAGTVTIPERDLASFPSVFGTKGLRGQLTANASWKGTPLAPTIDAHASVTHGRADVAVIALPVDLDFTGHYDGRQADAVLNAQTRGTQVLAAATRVDVRAVDLLDGLHGSPVPWRADAQAKLSGFPLQSLAVLDDRQVRGRASGELELEGLHDDAHATASLTLDDLSVADIPCKGASVKASLDGTMLDASSRVQQPDGYLSLLLRAGARWGNAMKPSFDPSQPVEMSVDAKQFRAGLLLPFVSNVFTELDGRVDATVGVQVEPGGKVIKPQGTVRLTDGVFELADVGGEFHDATAEIVLTPDGLVRLENTTAKGLSGKIEAAATARFAGLEFAGANGLVQVARQQPLPLVFDGTQVGTFDGRIGVAVTPTAGGPGLDVKVDVPQMTLQLPLASGNTVQSLGPIEGVHVGTPRPGDHAPSGPGGPNVPAAAAARTPLHVTVTLGSAVDVKRGTSLDVWMEGEPSVAVTNDVHASGQVRLVRGQIDVQGKTFTIENGTVTFVDDPTNPQVVLTASWVAPDGTTVYADFIGPLKTGKVSLRSDPPRSKDEILSLILFGTTDEQASAAAGGSPQASTAVGAAGGAATAPINRALGGVNEMLDNFGLAGGISTRIDTSQATPRPEVELQIARNISLQVAWVLGVPPPGSNPDTTLFTLDWRFLQHWSLETTVGDAGTSILDLVWQHRY